MTPLQTRDFEKNINFGNIDYLIKFSEDVAKTESTTENFLRRLEKTLVEQELKNGLDYTKLWTKFKWNDQEFSLRSSLKQLEENLRSYVARNEDE